MKSFISEKYIKWALILLMIALPLTKAGASIAMVLLSIMVLIKWTTNKSTLPALSLPTFSLVILYLVLATSLLYSSDFNHGLQELYRYNAFLLLPLVGWGFKEELSQWHRSLMLFFIGSLCFNAVFTMTLFFLPSDLVEKITGTISFLGVYEFKLNPLGLQAGMYSPFIERIQFSNLIAIGVISCIYLIRVHYHRLKVIAALITLLIASAMLGGRGGQLGLLSGVAIFSLGLLIAYAYPKLKTKAGAWGANAAVALALIALLCSPIIIYKTIPSVQERYNQMFWELSTFQNGTYTQHEYHHFTSVRRLISWKNAWQVVKSNPITGTGIGDYNDELTQAYSDDELAFTVNTHNQYLHFWGTIGLLGLLFFIGIIGHWVYVLYARSRLLFIWGLSFIGCYLVIFITDTVLITQVDNMLFSLFFIWIPLIDTE